jgi:hypothetical protein
MAQKTSGNANSAPETTDTPVTSTDVERAARKPVFDDSELRSLGKDFSLSQLVQSKNVPTVDIAEFGTGFTVLDNKDLLNGVEFAILDWRFSKGSYGDMVTLTLVTGDGRKFIINDGGSGIYKQMRTVDKALDGEPVIVMVAKGLTVSNYFYDDPKTGERKPAQTHYLSLDPQL